MKKPELFKAGLSFALYLFGPLVLLFLAAGSLRWTAAWVYTGLVLAATILSRLIVLIKNPDTLAERGKYVSSQKDNPRDRLLIAVIALFGPLVLLLLAGLDRRFDWPPALPLWAQILGGILVAGGYTLSVWAMAVNRYFSAVARIQKDRQHTVVSSGPYSFLRHPSYAGGIIGALAIPLLLDTLWALLPALVIAAAVVIRTRLEDSMLREGLEGYDDYASRVRFRLLPGVW